MISDNRNVSLGVVDFSLYTRRNALKVGYHKKKTDMLAYIPVGDIYAESLAITFIIPARQNQYIQENVSNSAPICRKAFAMITNSAFTGSYTKNPFWYQQFDCRQIRRLTGGQPNLTLLIIVAYFSTEAIIFQDDISSIPID